MSEEQLKAFLEKVKADTNLQEKLKAVATPDGQIAINDAISIAKEAGFEISASDLAEKEDLTEEQLEAITGGGNMKNLAQIGYVMLSIGSLGIMPATDAGLAAGLHDKSIWAQTNDL